MWNSFPDAFGNFLQLPPNHEAIGVEWRNCRHVQGAGLANKGDDRNAIALDGYIYEVVFPNGMDFQFYLESRIDSSEKRPLARSSSPRMTWATVAWDSMSRLIRSRRYSLGVA